LLLFASILVVVPGLAQEEDDLPTGAEVIDHYIQATGGKEAYSKIKSVVSKGKLSLAGTKGEVEIYQKEPNRMYIVFNIPGVGKIETGVNGKVAWESNPLTGAKLQSGAEKAKMLRTAALDSDYNWRKYYKSAKTVGEEKVLGKPAYRVDLVTSDGDKETRYFDKKTGLLVKTSQKVNSPMGEFQSEANISDYRKVGDIQMAHRIRQTMLGLEIEIQFSKIQPNVEIPDDRFELPSAVQELLKKL
jgi:outer membrane lipoprotein-sorting protein